MVRQIVWSPRSTVYRQIGWSRADQSSMSSKFLCDELVIFEFTQPDRDVESLRNQIDVAIGIFDVDRNTRIGPQVLRQHRRNPQTSKGCRYSQPEHDGRFPPG